MLGRKQFAAVSAAMAVSGCTSMFFAHDPQAGPMSRDQIPPFLHSIRCELITFYEANKQRQQLFNVYKNRDREKAVGQYSYFELSDSLFGGIYLDLKVIDTVNLPAPGTNFNQKYSPDSNHSTAWHLGPTFSDTNTYQVIRAFLIGQNQTLNGPIISAAAYEEGVIPSADSFQCYKAIPQTPDGKHLKKLAGFEVRDFDGLARDDYPNLKQFQRMHVNAINGSLPLAAWLQQNMADTWSNFAARDSKAEQKENIIPAQVSYFFTVQVQLGLDVSYSLVSTRWNPLAFDAAGSSQQTSFVQFVLNGPDASLAGGAKTGTAAINKETTPLPQLPGTPPSPSNRGYLIYPLPLPLPQQQ